MQIPNLRSPREQVGGLYHFGRMLDKIRLHAAGQLPAEYHGDLGKGFDGRCVRFLHVDYPALKARVLQGGTDDEILAWCFERGRKPEEDEVAIWNAFMSKRGWNDEVSERLRQLVEADGALRGRTDIRTFFDQIDADEGRL